MMKPLIPDNVQHNPSCVGRVFWLSMALLTLTGCDGSAAPSMLEPKGRAAAHVADLWWLLFWMALGVFVVVFGFLLLGIFRRRTERPDAELSARRGRRVVVVGGIVAPIVILLVVFVATLWTLRALAMPAVPEEYTVHVVGQRWWWEVQYPVQQFATANEIHIPVGQPVRVLLSSPNVIHSFWVPELQGKLDLMPGHVNTMWLEADEPGIYRGLCAEFCGVQHAKMQFLVIAQPLAEYEAWLAQQQQAAQIPADGPARAGYEVFMNSSCIECHTIRGTDATGNLGPDLTHLASRRSLASAILPNTRGNLGGWISDPQHVKPGSLMPPATITGTELQDLLDFLETLE